MNVVSDHDSYFVQSRDECGHMCLSMFQKCITIFKMLTYGVPPHATYEYCRLAKTIATECLKHFARMILAIFEREYLW